MSRVWSEYQLAIFREVAEGTGHVVVRARAGAAKTTTIIEAMNYIPPGNTVLMVAFNRSIAAELKDRAPRGVEVKTLHGYGLTTCNRRWGKCELSEHKAYDLARALFGSRPPPAPEGGYPEGEREPIFIEDPTVLRTVARLTSIAKGSLYETPSDIDRAIDAFGIDLEENVSREKVCLAAIMLLEVCRNPATRAVKEGDTWKIVDVPSQPVIDFDDMIWLPVVHDLKPWQYSRVFIDETQDLNAAQIALALRAVRQGGRIVAVGDERQAIYGFRGADNKALDNVIRRLRAKIMRLSVTYRCARNIVREANRFVPDFEAAPEAVDGEVVKNVAEDRMRKEAKPGDFILSRTNAPLIGLCLGFLRDGKRASIQGRNIGQQLVKFVERSRCNSIEDLEKYIADWRGTETARLLKFDPPRDTQAVEDKAETLIALAEGCQSVAQLTAKIDALFSDTGIAEADDKIVLSTTHKAKGLERERAWVLDSTYLRRPDNIEEQNLFYVAVTRAKKSLYLVKLDADKK